METLLPLGILTLAGGWWAGMPAVLGVLAGGALALGDFWWLAGRATAASAADAPGVSVWAFGAGVRLIIVAVASAVLFLTGWVHPVALVAGLTVLPCGLVAHGLRTAREGA